MTSANIHQHLFDLELRLMSQEIRKSPEKLKSLLHPSFFEFGTTGRFIPFEDVLQRLPQEQHTPFIASDFQARELGPNIAQVTFKTERSNGNEIIRSLRSSIWKKESHGWQMIFHQGTRIID